MAGSLWMHVYLHKKQSVLLSHPDLGGSHSLTLGQQFTEQHAQGK